MTPKLKAKELVDKYYYDDLLLDDLSFIQAKQCALIAVEFSISSYRQIERFETFEEYQRLLEVKQEIEKL